MTSTQLQSVNKILTRSLPTCPPGKQWYRYSLELYELTYQTKAQLSLNRSSCRSSSTNTSQTVAQWRRSLQHAQRTTQEHRNFYGLLIQLIEVRSDIVFAISKISQRQHPTVQDYKVLMQIVNYSRTMRLSRYPFHESLQSLSLSMSTNINN
jgi:hypothetical protein